MEEIHELFHSFLFSVPVFAINLKVGIEKIVGALAQLLQTEIQMTKKRQQYENCIKVPKKNMGCLDVARTMAWAKKAHSNHLNTLTGVVVTLYFHESDFG